MTLPRVVGRYTLHHEIAAGGMATVYLGKLRGPARFSPVVAIKSLHPHFAKEQDFVRMFLDEARLASHIRHANIVPVMDVNEEDELFLVLEYIHGESLANLLRACAQQSELVPLPIVSAVVGDVLRGLHAAHEARDEDGRPLGVVHRDVSPHNVLVGVDGVARVFDFGVAKAAGRLTMTRQGQVKGKFAYMSPEHLRGEEVNRQADVFSAAVVLSESLTGRRLFKGEAEGIVVQRVLFDAIPAPSTFRPELPAAIDAIVMRGLSRERSNRFSTANEMALELQRVLPPALPHVVGAWVERWAMDALSDRTRAISMIEKAAVEVSPAAMAAAPRPRRWKVAAAAAGVVALGASGLWIGLRPRPAATPAAAALAPSAAPEATAVPPGPTVLATPSELAPAEAPPPARPLAMHAKASGVPKHATAAPSTSPSTRCARRGPDGIIEFDTQCLREAQHSP